MNRRAAAALAAVLVVLCLSGAAAAQTPPPGQQGTLRIDSQTDWVTPPQNFDISVAASASTTADQLVVYEAVYAPVRTRSEFALTLDDVFARRPFYTTTISYDRLPAASGIDGDRLLRLPVNEPSTSGVYLRAPGVYPVQLQLRDRSGTVLDKVTTHLLYVDSSPNVTRLNVSWIIPFHAPPTMQPDGSRVIDPASAARLQTIANALVADPSTAKVPVVIVPTPDTVEALLNNQSATDRATITTLTTAVQAGSGREVATTTYVPVNVPGLLGAGMGGEFAAQLLRGTDTLAVTFGAPPTAKTWVAQDPVDTTTLDALAHLGITRVVMDERALVPINLSLTLTAPFQVETGGAGGGLVDVVAGDPALAGYFNDPRPVLAAHRLLADLAVLWDDRPQEQRSVAILTPRSWNPDPAMMQALLGGLATSPILAPVTLDGLFSVPKATGPPGPNGVRPTLVRSLVITPASDAPPLPPLKVTATRDIIEALRTVLPAGYPLVDDAERQLLAAEAEELSSSQRNAVLQGLSKRLADQTAQFRLPPSRTITLTARSARIPITVENDALFPAKLHLVLRSQGLVFSGSSSDSQEVALELTHKFTTVEFTVRTRTSGVFGMTVQLVAPNGTPVSPVTHVTIRSTAASGVGIVLSVGAAVFLAVWWVRNARSGRRARRLVPPDTPVDVLDD